MNYISYISCQETVPNRGNWSEDKFIGDKMYCRQIIPKTNCIGVKFYCRQIVPPTNCIEDKSLRQSFLDPFRELNL